MIGCGISTNRVSLPSYSESEPPYIEDTSEPPPSNDQVPATEPPPPHGMPTGGDSLIEIEVPVRTGEPLEVTFQQIQNEISFPLSTPTDIPGFGLGSPFT